MVACSPPVGESFTQARASYVRPELRSNPALSVFNASKKLYDTFRFGAEGFLLRKPTSSQHATRGNVGVGTFSEREEVLLGGVCSFRVILQIPATSSPQTPNSE
jgi:hypothetical protein